MRPAPHPLPATMSIKSLLMPAISERLLSLERLNRRRATAERARVAAGRRHQLLYFHQVDDPYSALVAASLPQLLARYDVDLTAHVVGPPPDAAAPEREKLVDWSRRDAQLLAHRFNLPFADPGAQPPPAALGRAGAQLVAAAQAGLFVEAAGLVSAGLWRTGSQTPAARAAEAALPVASPSSVARHITDANALRERLGHYLGATLYYAGEWYWGVDRLHHLEQRLQALGAQRPGTSGVLYPPGHDTPPAGAPAHPAAIDFFFSLRSPYSAIAAPRVFHLGRQTGAPVHLRYVLPMVMRGLPVPGIKRRYISLDAAREARWHGVPFGRLNDPVGRPTERGLALMPLAERMGKGQDYVLSFMRGVWAEGVDAGSDRGLRTVAERAGLDWGQALEALRDDGWRATAEHNRAELFALGLWGVPSFRVRDTAVWGQDRLWAVRDALLHAQAPMPAATAEAP